MPRAAVASTASGPGAARTLAAEWPVVFPGSPFAVLPHGGEPIASDRLLIQGTRRTIAPGDEEQGIDVAEGATGRSCFAGICGVTLPGDRRVAGLVAREELDGPELPEPLNYSAVPGGHCVLAPLDGEGTSVLSNTRLERSGTGEARGSASPANGLLEVHPIRIRSASVRQTHPVSPSQPTTFGVVATYAWTITNGSVTAGSGSRSITSRACSRGRLRLAVTVTCSSGCWSTGSGTCRSTDGTSGRVGAGQLAAHEEGRGGRVIEKTRPGRRGIPGRGADRIWKRARTARTSSPLGPAKRVGWRRSLSGAATHSRVDLLLGHLPLLRRPQQRASEALPHALSPGCPGGATFMIWCHRTCGR